MSSLLIWPPDWNIWPCSINVEGFLWWVCDPECLPLLLLLSASLWHVNWYNYCKHRPQSSLYAHTTHYCALIISEISAPLLQIAQLNSLINMLLGELSPGDRQKIMTLCTVEVHARDVVFKLITQKVWSCLQWISCNVEAVCICQVIYLDLCWFMVYGIESAPEVLGPLIKMGDGGTPIFIKGANTSDADSIPYTINFNWRTFILIN